MPDSMVDNPVPTSEEKKINDSVSIDVLPKSYLLASNTPIALQPQITIQYNNPDIGAIDISLS
jgi:hypothetical protein